MPVPEPTLFVFMGLIASGKSTLAQAFGASQGLPVYNSDVVRKKLAGVQAGQKSSARFSGGIYTPEFSRRTYQELLRLAAEEQDRGHSVILDASYHKKEERQHVIDFCQARKCGYLFILCQASEEETRRRLALRSQDPQAVSDGSWDIYLQQKERFQYPHEIDPAHFLEVATDKPVNELLTLLVRSSKIPPFSS
ncbi:MAG: AAA family ATPase [Desulfurivibrionaceae bacterium]|nr:AAA family ATPase [Desulfurivibrionaceae bacterium]